MENHQLEPRKAGFWQALVVILVNQLPMMAIVALMPALPTLMAHFKDVGNKDLLVPMILTAPGICIALIAPFAGVLVDKFGRRKLLIWFTALYGLGGILPYFLDGFNTVITGRLLLGVGEAFVLVIGNTLLGDYFTQKDRTKWLTIQIFFGSIAAALLLSLSGHLANMGWNYPFLVYSISFLITLLAVIFIFEPEEKLTSDIDTPLSADSKFPINTTIGVFLATFCISILYFVYTIHFSRALDYMGIKDKIQLGNMSAITSTAVPLGALIFKLVSKRPFWQQMALMFLFFAIGLAGIGLAKDTTTAMMAGWIQQLGCGMTIPVLVAWALNLFPVQYRGRGMGFWTSAFFLGQFLNPVFVSGITNYSGGVQPTFFVVGIICLAVTVILVVYNLFLGKKMA
ncbi:MAG: MFS transporter [Saprospiraceae bacterium]|nr:MFS transporter [Saprospiraceae bacterium]